MVFKKSILSTAIIVIMVSSVKADPRYNIIHISGSDNPAPINFQNQFVSLNNNGEMAMIIKKAKPTNSSVAAVSMADKWLVINQNGLPSKFSYLNLAVMDINNKGEVLGILPTVQGSYGFVASFSKVSDKAGNVAIQQTNRGLGQGVIGVAINDNSQVVGSYVTNDGKEHAFVHANGILNDLGTLGNSDYSIAYDINNCGQIVGESNGHAFVGRAGLIKDLGDKIVAKSINDSGQMTGIHHVVINGIEHQHAFIADNKDIKDLGTLGGDDSTANKINAMGQVVGSSKTAQGEQHAFTTINGVMTDLNNLIDPKTLTDPSTIDLLTRAPLVLDLKLQNAISINDKGEVLVAGYSAKGRYHTFLLAPAFQNKTDQTQKCSAQG